LLAAANASGHSIAQEIELRLERSIWLEDLLKARLAQPHDPTEEGVLVIVGERA
jgi:hypothetical protein